MEIKYESFSKWRNIALGIEKLIPYDIVTPGDIYAYIINEPHEIEKSVQARLIETANGILKQRTLSIFKMKYQAKSNLISQIVMENKLNRFRPTRISLFILRTQRKLSYYVPLLIVNLQYSFHLFCCKDAPR